MIAALALALQTAAAAAVVATPASVTVRAPDRNTTIPVVRVAGEAVVDAARAAAALGGRARALAGGRIDLTLGGSTVHLDEGVPFAVLDDSTVIPLTGVPRVVGSTVYIPFQIVSEVAPRFLSGYFYDPQAAEVRIFDTRARRIVQPDAAGTPAVEREGGASPPSPAGERTRGAAHLVVVDAGHGGPDNGMTGPIGPGPRLVEKNITLAVAKLVARDLRGSGARVLMTRTTDTLIALSDRGRIANRAHGDVFVSIHVNATGSRGSAAARERGFETYFLSEAKSEDARRVERMENESVKFETGVNAPKGDPLGFILNDMAQNEHLRESEKLAQVVQDGLAAFHPGPSRGVQQANFAVLRGSYMPAILVEIGFGTNPDEARFLESAAGQAKIARSISESVLSYLAQYDARVRAGR